MWFPFFLLLHYTHLQYVVINTHPFNTFTIKSLFILTLYPPSISLLLWRWEPFCDAWMSISRKIFYSRENCVSIEQFPSVQLHFRSIHIFVVDTLHLDNIHHFTACVVWKFIFTLHNIFVSAFCQVSLLFLKRKNANHRRHLGIITCFHVHKKSLKRQTNSKCVNLIFFSSWKFIFGTSFAANHNLYMLAKCSFEKLA